MILKFLEALVKNIGNLFSGSSSGEEILEARHILTSSSTNVIKGVVGDVSSLWVLQEHIDDSSCICGVDYLSGNVFSTATIWAKTSLSLINCIVESHGSLSNSAHHFLFTWHLLHHILEIIFEGGMGVVVHVIVVFHVAVLLMPLLIVFHIIRVPVFVAIEIIDDILDAAVVLDPLGGGHVPVPQDAVELTTFRVAILAPAVHIRTSVVLNNFVLQAVDPLTLQNV